MATDPSVILAFTTALAGDTANTVMCVHLASLPLESSREKEALDHCKVVLAAQPDHTEALQQASTAATAIGNAARSASFRRLYEALTWQQTKGMLDELEAPPHPDLPERQPAMPKREPPGS